MSPDSAQTFPAHSNRPHRLCRRGRRILWPLLLGVSILVSGCSGKAPEAPDKPVLRPVKSLLLPHTTGAARSFPGTVRASNRVDLSFNVPGTLIELPAREGEEVARGRLLARLNPNNYQMAVNAAKAEYDEAVADYHRYKELVEKGFVSRADYDRMVAAREVAESKLEQTQKLLDDTSLKAPFDGVVARRYVENFTDVTARKPVLSLQDTHQLEIVVDVPEDVVIRENSTENLNTVAEFSVLPGREFPVTLKEFSTRADPKTLTYRVVFALPSITDVNILPGMTAKVTLTPKATGGRPQFRLPASALLEADDKSWLWVIQPDSNSVTRRQVEAAPATDGKVLIRGGVEPGERIVVAGVHHLKEGMVVKPVQEIQY